MDLPKQAWWLQNNRTVLHPSFSSLRAMSSHSQFMVMRKHEFLISQIIKLMMEHSPNVHFSWIPVTECAEVNFSDPFLLRWCDKCLCDIFTGSVTETESENECHIFRKNWLGLHETPCDQFVWTQFPCLKSVTYRFIIIKNTLKSMINCRDSVLTFETAPFFCV
jgi:hypothetical protein